MCVERNLTVAQRNTTVEVTLAYMLMDMQLKTITLEKNASSPQENVGFHVPFSQQKWEGQGGTWRALVCAPKAQSYSDINTTRKYTEHDIWMPNIILNTRLKIKTHTTNVVFHVCYLACMAHLFH